MDNFEGVVEFVHCFGLGQLVVLYEVSPVLVDDGVEGQTVPPGGGEVPHVDVVVASSLDLAPQQQGVLGRPRLLALLLHHGDLLDLEPQDDGPDETEGESGVAVHDVVGAHILQVNSLLVEEAQGLVHVLQAVNSHLSFGRFGLQECLFKTMKIVSEMLPVFLLTRSLAA